MKALRMIVGLAALLATTGVAFAQVNGPKPPPGAVQPMGPLGTVYGAGYLHAVINADGTRQRGDGDVPYPPSTTTTKIGTGTYDVRFRRNITPCAFVGTIGLSSFSGTELPGFIMVVGRVGTTTGVFVETRDTTGALADRGFHLVIKC